MLSHQNEPTGRPGPAAFAAFAALVMFGVIIGYAVTEGQAPVALLIATLAPFVILFLLARPASGLYALVFLAPYVDVFKTASMGVTIRFSEAFGLLLFLVTLMHLLKNGQRFRLSIVDCFIFGVLASMVISMVANLGNLPSADRLQNIPTAWIGVTGDLDKPHLATYKKMLQALVAFAAYFAASNLITTLEVWRKAVKVLVISSMLVCFWALLNLVGFMGGMSSGLGLRASGIWFAGGAPRMTGTLSEPSYFANFLVMVIPIAFFNYARRSALLSHRWDLIAIILLCVTLFFTFSGGGWVVFALEIVLLLGVCIRHGLPLRKFGMMVFALVILAVLGLMAVAVFTDMDYSLLAESNWQKVVDLFSEGVGSGRRVAPDVGWMMFCDHPLFGVGPGRFRTFEYDYLLDLGFTEDTPASSFYATVLGELGAIGTVMVIGTFASVICLCFRWARRTRHGPTQTILWGMAVAVIAISAHYVAHATFWWPYVWVMFGLANSGVRLAKDLELAGGAGGTHE
ncbi:MAG: O-antigen ligase family protein [Planctomycetes bacterium]|nr:O-antigen ligase family protein [Planctomycetota bacterium]